MTRLSLGGLQLDVISATVVSVVNARLKANRNFDTFGDCPNRYFPSQLVLKNLGFFWSVGSLEEKPFSFIFTFLYSCL